MNFLIPNIEFFDCYCIIYFISFILFIYENKLWNFARATIENPSISSSMGVDVKTYTITFAIGAGLAGVTGALYAPT